MAHNHHSQLPLLCLMQKRLPDLALGHCVKHRGDLIRQQIPRICRQRSGNTEPLQFAAGKLRWKPIQPFFPDAKPSPALLIHLTALTENLAHPPAWVERLLRVLPD